MLCTLITIGEELLIGQVIDSNSAWIAKQLNATGIQVRQIISISDDKDEIISNVERTFKMTDLIIMTGGLGPTHDDITKKALARYYQVPLKYEVVVYESIRKLLNKFGRQPTPSHKLQAEMPSNAELLMNNMGTAPGMWFENGGKILISLPGVPYEMRHLMEKEVLPRLKSRLHLPVLLHHTVLTVGEGESRLAHMLEDFERKLPDNFALAYLPGTAQVRIRLSCTADNKRDAQSKLERYSNELESYIKPFIFGYGESTLEKEVGILLRDAEMTVSTAESCTGGYLAHMLTSVPGSSAYFRGSIIAYDNRIKEEQLGVKTETLIEHGAVSQAVVTEMAEGGRRSLGTDFTLATSGIAGPDGGTPEKPVGTVWLACAGPERTKTYKLSLSKDRKINIQYSSVVALNMLRKFLRGLQ